MAMENPPALSDFKPPLADATFLSTRTPIANKVPSLYDLVEQSIAKVHI